jgi:hypothetical protein
VPTPLPGESYAEFSRRLAAANKAVAAVPLAVPSDTALKRKRHMQEVKQRAKHRKLSPDAGPPAKEFPGHEAVPFGSQALAPPVLAAPARRAKLAAQQAAANPVPKASAAATERAQAEAGGMAALRAAVIARYRAANNKRPPTVFPGPASG